MRRNFLLVSLFMTVMFPLNILQAQKGTKNIPEEIQLLPKLTAADSIGLLNLPVLTLPEWLKGPDAPVLPVEVDNSQNMYWRPVFAQVDYECGQASGVGLGFTYEINRLRNLPSNLVENQYPPHYCWNWGNGGENWYGFGVSYFHSFEIIKTGGTPDVNTYGGMYVGDEYERKRHWMTGYDNYYEAMHNRINELYQIDVSTEEGILTLKNWIHNHLDGSETGGVANFYANAPYGMATLPQGTPEAGKYVVLSWGGANHGMTICAYHDSIRYDYNNDGQYTNDIDINGDGVVNVRDWEIGGFKFANTYSGGPNFGNNGFSYMTYKSCADPSENGGIWNNAVHVLYAKEQCEPLLTAKITLKHVCRDKIKVRMGYSTDQTATTPDFILEFPVFNYQGGCLYLQGGDTEEDKTLEFGLDITPFLNMIGSGTPARFFLLVNENDPSNQYEGEIIQYSIIDYTNGVNEIHCGQYNVTLQNGLNKLWIDHTVTFDDVNIETGELPEATVFEPYSTQLVGEGGLQPYYFDFDRNFVETDYSETFPNVSQTNITPSNTSTGHTTIDLPFDFPFYDETFDQVKVYVNGYISLGDYIEWPYQVYDFLLFTKNKFIAPFKGNVYINLSSGDGMWYEEQDGFVSFRWNASVEGQSTSDLNFAVRLYHNGDIKFYYGDNVYSGLEWISGVSAGNNIYYQFTEVSNKPVIEENYVCDLSAAHVPVGFTLSPGGLFSGLPQYVYNNFEIRFRLRDSRNIYSTKPLLFSTDGTNFIVIDDYSVNAGGNDILEFGESAGLSVTMRSLGEQIISGVNMKITTEDEFITVTDSTEYLGDFLPEESKTFENAFAFDVSNAVPNNYLIDFNTLTTDDTGEEWASHIYLTAYSPIITSGEIIVDDGGNGGLDPGETADLILSLKNTGGAQANNLNIEISSGDPFITVNVTNAVLPFIAPGASEEIVFNVTASGNALVGHIIEFDINITADNDYSTETQAYTVIGFIYESFETGDFTAMPWQMGGDTGWVIDDTQVYMGDYSARSGDVEDNESSTMEMEVCILVPGEISFAHQVSSEENYDFLRFYIDGNEMASWDGEQPWEESSFNISAGIHTLKWAYEKDYSISNGQDCGWVDYIFLPPFGDSDPQIVYSPGVIQDTLLEGEIAYDTVIISNTGSGAVIYNIEIADTLGNPVDWLTLSQMSGGLNAGASDSLVSLINTNGLATGDYKALITISDHLNNEYIIEVLLNVSINTGIVPGSLSSSVAFPNPFTGNITIEFHNTEQTNRKILIYNATGNLVRTLESNQGAGINRVLWDGTDNLGMRVEPGVYYFQIYPGNSFTTGKIIKLN